MKHIYDRPRPPISRFELLVIEALSKNLRHLHSIWMRYEQDLATKAEQPILFIVLDKDERERVLHLTAFLRGFAPTLEVRVHINEYPPEEILPACIFRREALDLATIQRNDFESNPRR